MNLAAKDMLQKKKKRGVWITWLLNCFKTYEEWTMQTHKGG